MPNEPTTTSTDPSSDNEVTARRTIEYLTYHPPLAVVLFSTNPPPSEEMRHLLEPYMKNIEIQVGETVARYLQESLVADCLESKRLGATEDGA